MANRKQKDSINYSNELVRKKTKNRKYKVNKKEPKYNRVMRGQDPATKYAKKIGGEDLIAGKYVIAACRRHLNDLMRQGDKDFPYFWDVEMGNKIIEFARHMTLEQGKFEGKPFVPMLWQEFFLRSIFGWVDKDGMRRFRYVYLETGKGSAKGILTAVMSLYQLYCEDEDGAQIFHIGKNIKQGRIIFDYTANMMQRNPILSKEGYIMGGSSRYKIIYKNRFINLVASASKGKGHSGHVPNGIYIDELHEFDDRAIIDIYEAGIKHRRQPLIVTTTNTGYGFGNICHDTHMYAKNVIEGRVEDDRYFSLIYAIDEGDEPFKDEQCLLKANPTLPDTPGWEYLRGEMRRSKNMPSKRAEFLRLNCGVWRDAVDAWLDVDEWNKAEVNELPDVKGRKVFIGLDLAARSDLAAAVIAWDLPDGEVAVETQAWIPSEGIKDKGYRDGVPYEAWVDLGYLEACDGKYIEFSYIAKWMFDVFSQYKVVSVAYDAWGKNVLLNELENVGIDLVDTRRYGNNFTSLVVHPQGYLVPQNKPKYELWPAMPRSISHVEALLLKRKLHVLRSPVLRSAVLSASPVFDGSGNRRLMKNKVTHRIDAAIAMITAVGVLMDWRIQRRVENRDIESMIL